MRVYQRELKRLNSVKSFVQRRYPSFGINKKQEITRLLYEISKRENISPSGIIQSLDGKGFFKVKKYLLQRRYPFSFWRPKPLRPYLPKIELKSAGACDLERKEFYPKCIFIEENAVDSFIARRFKEFFPKAKFSRIKSLKDYHCSHRNFDIEDYNKRQDTVFIISEEYDFFKKCPCTKNALGCGYRIFNLGFGCIFECTYCYLQFYSNCAGIIIPANISRFFDTFHIYKRKGLRLGTGEFTDSLALDNITEFSLSIIEFFRKQNDITFEFKTKSNRINNLLKVPSADNIVISWSLNPQSIINENEYFTSSLKERITASRKCVQAGYRVGFHFDPVIYSQDWQRDYAGVIDLLFENIKPRDIAWVSIGTFRFRPDLKPIIEKRFPQNRILDEELVLAFDNKLRYPDALRYNIYRYILDLLSRHNRNLKIYLCMEENSLWKKLNLTVPLLR